VLIHPTLQMPAITKFIDGSGLVFAGPVFPFVFITIACGAVSGFHSLIASGTTPKMLGRESRIRDIGYGAMVTEMMVALMAMIAACVLLPGEYFAINTTGTPVEVVERVSASGFLVTEQQMAELAHSLGESTMFNRAGGAPTFAVGMAHMFARVSSNHVRSALYPDDDRRRHAGRSLSASGFVRQFVATTGQYAIMGSKLFCKRVAGHGLGLVPLPGRDRPTGRYQQSLAVVRAGKSIAFRDRALSVHDSSDQDAENAISFRDARASGIHVRRYVFGRVPEDFFG
jgi:hypothetical protein